MCVFFLVLSHFQFLISHFHCFLFSPIYPFLSIYFLPLSLPNLSLPPHLTFPPFLFPVFIRWLSIPDSLRLLHHFLQYVRFSWRSSIKVLSRPSLALLMITPCSVLAEQMHFPCFFLVLQPICPQWSMHHILLLWMVIIISEASTK